MSNNADDYDVGYGKPPKHTQFKPGKSGNPKGRPKQTRNFKTDLQEELQALVTVSEGGKTKTVSRQQAVIMRTMEKALQGDLKAVKMLVGWASTYLMEEPDLLASLPVTQEDQALLDRYGLSRGTEPEEGLEPVDGKYGGGEQDA
jgi:hypothetical protein|tara:strand:+ start:587 stop:1021 length:435 start_codon:yes stop_codon:yes gene_type:complete